MNLSLLECALCHYSCVECSSGGPNDCKTCIANPEIYFREDRAAAENSCPCIFGCRAKVSIFLFKYLIFL